MKVDSARRRISLGIPHEKAEVGEKVVMPPVKVGDVVTGKVEKVEKYGVFLRLGPGRTGMIPNNELGTARGADHRKMFPLGTEMTAEVIETDPGGRKIRLSVNRAQGREERAAVDKYRKDPAKSGTSSFSTMADAFNALKKGR
jgi:small subunit ribosomal protein S1